MTKPIMIMPSPVLKLPRQPKPFITAARGVLTAMDGSPHFPSPSPPLAVFAAHIDALAEAEAAVLGGGQGAADLRNARMNDVRADLGHLRDYVQLVVEAQTAPADAAAIITGAGMHVRRQAPKRVRAPFSAKGGPLPGTALLYVRPVANYAAYCWQVSTDEVAWTDLPGTLKASTMVTDLTRLTVYHFRFRAVTRTGRTDWSPPVSFVVQ